MPSTDLFVDVRHRQFRFDDHDDDAEHAEHERVVRDALAFLEQSFALPEPISETGLGVDALGRRLLLRVLRVVGVQTDEGYAAVLR